MNATEFIAKWRKSSLTESAASQEHFLDLCALLGHPTPAAADPEGASFTFERGAAKRGGGDGWADVWKKGFFGWEYKGKHKDLDAAYKQLLQYAESLENPRLLVVCDMERIIVHTHFNDAPHREHEIRLNDLGSPQSLDILRAVFYDPERLKPGDRIDKVTEQAARHIAEIAQSLRDRGLEPHAVARFLDRIVFCLFAEDVGLLPDGLFARIVGKTRDDAARFSKMLGQLFDAMAHGGDFGMESIPHFNGDLFTEAPVLDLTLDEIESVHAAAKLDWSAIQPSIFGTLFERGLDPDKRSQLGAHYTSRDDIVTLVEPVVMQPLRREWGELRATLDALLTTGKKEPGAPPKTLRGAALAKARDEAIAFVNRFRIRLSQIKVLDPACGSGNFLYVTLQLLKDLEKAVITYAADHDLGMVFPYVLPTQLYGIEKNAYAYELAQMTVWIGHLQWNRNNGFDTRETPILRPMRNFECKDAILERVECVAQPPSAVSPSCLPHAVQPPSAAAAQAKPREDTAEGGCATQKWVEPEWPRVDFIVGNPPFLGGNKVRHDLGDEYVERLFSLYRGRIGATADLCCYWFEKARAHVERGLCKRAGLLATQGIRGGVSREVLKRIKATGGIFFAVSDRDWILDGASVHVSMVGFDDGTEHCRVLDGASVTTVNSDLTSEADLTAAQPIVGRCDLWFYGSQTKAPFSLSFEDGLRMLAAPNPSGRPNSDVVKLSLNAAQLMQGGQPTFVIDFEVAREEMRAALYEAPFEDCKRRVYPLRKEHREALQRRYWWLHARPSRPYRSYLAQAKRCIITPNVSKHRVFAWLDPFCLASHLLVVFAASDDCFLGVLHSRPHELWSRAQATQLREAESGCRYTPTTCFETFPFPQITAAGGCATQIEAAIGEAARELNELREAWLNPPEWTRTEVLEFPGTVGGPWTRFIDQSAVGSGQSAASQSDKPIIGTVRYPRLVPKDAECAKKLKARTLTNLYNQRPTWLDLAHQKLDAAVFAAYGWDPAMGDEEILEKLLALNLERAAAEQATP